MEMKLGDETDILDQAFRSNVIEAINSSENNNRKLAMKKRHDVFRDLTSSYVIEQLRQELGDETVQEMIHRTSNLSISRKIIEKKAMVYKDGISRETSDETDQVALDFIVDKLNINSLMKKVNKYVELFKNTEIFISPYLNKATQKWTLQAQALRPMDYDVIEDADNPEIPRVYVFSYYSSSDQQQTAHANPNESGFHSRRGSNISFRSGDNRDQVIADSPNDAGEGEKKYVWWSTNFHFTTDEKGEIIAEYSPENMENPIGCLPFVSFSSDRDGSFWAVGGEDLTDGSVLINMLLTDLYYIAKLQGMGIFYLFGKGVPKRIKIGPADAITLDVRDGDPTPQIGFASSNPPLSSHMSLIEQYLAMLLSTNNLEVTTVQGKLGVNNAASGLQEMIRRAENIDDIEDQREMYRDNEPQLFKIIFKWINVYNERGLIDDEYKMLGTLNVDMPITLKFNQPSHFQTEKEKLEILEKRRTLGLDSMIDMLIRDNPDMGENEAKEKVLKILEEKLELQTKRTEMFGLPTPPNQQDESDDDENEDESDDEKDDENKDE